MTALRFVDTNILIYAHGRDAGIKHDKARQILTDLMESGKRLFECSGVARVFRQRDQKNPATVTNSRGSRSDADLLAVGQNGV